MASLARLNDTPPVSAPYRIDVSRGGRSGRVSSEWFSRPDDEKFLSLSSLYDSVRARADHSTTRIVESRAIRVEARSDNPERLMLIAPGDGRPVAPTNWSFGQISSLVGAPASYLRQLPAALAGINLQHGLITHRGEQVKLLQTDDGRTELKQAEFLAKAWRLANDKARDLGWIL